MFDASGSELLWFVLGLVFMLAELALPGFVIIFFGVGAWITALGIWTGLLESFTSQLIIFLLGSVLSLVLFRRQGKKYFEGKISGRLPAGKDLDDITGEHAVVVETIAPHAAGKVEFHGTHWQAQADMKIEKGTTVEIAARTNLTLKVKPVSY